MTRWMRITGTAAMVVGICIVATVGAYPSGCRPAVAQLPSPSGEVTTAPPGPGPGEPVSSAPEWPPPVEATDIYRVDLSRLASGWLPVFQTNAPELIAEISRVYNDARAAVTVNPLPVPCPESLPFRPHLNLLLYGGERLSLLWLVDDETRVGWRSLDGTWTHWVVKNQALADWLDQAPSRFEFPGCDPWIRPTWRPRVGDEVTIFLEGLPEERVDLYIWASYTPYTIPSGPDGYPVPEAAFIGSADPFEGRVAFTFRLNSVGRRPDGSPLVVRPGSYTIQAGGTGGSLFVRPAETPPRVAAVKDGMIVTWSAGEGVRSQSLAEEDIPRRRGDMAYTWVTTRLLSLLGLEVEPISAGTYIFGPPDARVEIRAGSQKAMVNGTELNLVFPCEAVPGGLSLCFGETDLACLLDYQVRRPAPGEFYFVWDRPEAPVEFYDALGFGPGPGGPPLVVVNGAPVEGRSLLVDEVLYVPAVEFAAACHGVCLWEGGTVSLAADFGGVRVEADLSVTASPRVTGGDIPLDRPALNRDGKVYLPVEALAEAWYGEADWDTSGRVLRLWFDPWG